jgi:hypothetical protein
MNANAVANWQFQSIEGINFSLYSDRFIFPQNISERQAEAPSTKRDTFSEQFPSMVEAIFNAYLLGFATSPGRIAEGWQGGAVPPFSQKSLAWMALTREVLKDSRRMTDWERKAAADFFWSQFD